MSTLPLFHWLLHRFLVRILISQNISGIAWVIGHENGPNSIRVLLYGLMVPKRSPVFLQDQPIQNILGSHRLVTYFTILSRLRYRFCRQNQRGTLHHVYAYTCRMKQTEFESYHYVTQTDGQEEYYHTNLSNPEYHTNADMNNQTISIDFQNASTSTYNNIQASEHDAINVISNFSNEMIHSNNNNAPHSNVMSIQHISNNAAAGTQNQGAFKRKREEVTLTGILGLKNHMEKRLMQLESEVRGIRAELNQFTNMLLQSRRIIMGFIY